MKKTKDILVRFFYIKNSQIYLHQIKSYFSYQPEDLNRDKVRIKKNWDQFPTDKKNDESVYVGREKNLKHLKHWLNNSNVGSLLVSGVRGVGKTSFVYKAIYEAKKTNKLIKLVEINGSTMSSDSTKNIDLIRNIIESLYYLDQKNIKSLRELAQSSEANNKKTTRIKHGYKFNFFIKIPIQILLFLLLFSFLNFIPLPSINSELFIQITTYRQIVSLILSLLLGHLAIELFYERKTENNIVLNIETNNFVYLKNLLIETLKSNGFWGIFRKKKYVFVIDELDKIKKFKDFEIVVKSVKSLITIPEAQFIFVCDDRLHSSLKSRITTKNPYPESSTYFTWEIFLPPLTSKDIADFMKRLFVTTLDEDQEYKVDGIALFIYSQTAGIPSRIKSLLRDFINHFENDDAYIDLNILDEDKLKIARLTKLYELVIERFDSKEYSKQRLNHDRREILFPIFKKIVAPSTSFNGTMNVHELINNTLNPAINSFNPMSIQYQLLVDEVIQIFSEINNRADSKSQLSNPEVNASDGINFSLDKSQVSPKIDDLTKLKLTNLENELIEKLDELNKNLQKIKNRLGIINDSRLLSIIDNTKDYFPSYQSINSIVKSIKNNDFIIQSNVKDRLAEIDEINLKLQQDFTNIIFNYLNPVLNFIYSMRPLRQNVLFESKDKRKKFRLETETVKSANDISEKIAKLLNDTHKGYGLSYFNNWEPKVVEENSPWKFDVFNLDIKTNHEFYNLKFQTKIMTNYWRIGLALGHNAENIKPLGSDQYSFFHFHKDKASGYLRYERFVRIDGGLEVHEGFGTTKNIHPHSNLVVEIKGTSNIKESYIELIINNTHIDRFRVLKTDLSSASILVWTDNYKRTEPIVIETIIHKTRAIRRRSK